MHSTPLKSPSTSELSQPGNYLAQLENVIQHAAVGSQEASQRLDVERVRSDCWIEVCLELLQRHGWGVSTAQHDAITFYALTALQRSPLFKSDDPSNIKWSTLRSQLRTLLLRTISHFPSLQSMPNFVSTKVAVILALLVREDYPTAWTYPFKDVSSALSVQNGRSMLGVASNECGLNTEDNSGILMYLRFLDCISDEIVFPAADTDKDQTTSTPAISAASAQHISSRREQVKDVMRGFHINRDSQNPVVETSVPLEHTDAAHIISSLLDAITTNAITNNDAITLSKQEAKHDIASRAAMTLRRYLPWVELQLATHPGLVQCLLYCLGLAATGNAVATGYDSLETDDKDVLISDDGSNSSDTKSCTLLAAECANCLQEIVTRGMDESKKEALLIDLDVIDTLCHLTGLSPSSRKGCTSKVKLDITTVDGTQIEAVIAVAELINAIGLELIPCWELEPTRSLTPSAPVTMLMKQWLELVLACLLFDDIDVSGAVIDATSRVLASVERHESLWNDIYGGNGETFCERLINRVLIILHERMKYPSTFEFDYEDDIEAEEEMYRSQLRKLYQRIVARSPHLVLDFIRQCFFSLIQPLANSETHDIEVALRLVHHYGEGRRPPPGAKTALRDGPFREVLMALHRSNVSCHAHREVLLLYYDLSVRYAAILKEFPELLSNLLGGLTGTQGLQHPHARARSRCCYLLLRLVKSVGGKTMRPYVEVVVYGIQNLLFPPEGVQVLPIPFNDALYLFETTGILLGTTGLDDNLQQRCATAVLTPHVQSIERILQSLDLQRDAEVYAEQLSMSISAIAQLSKGWQSHPPPGVQSVLAAAVDISLKVLVALPKSPLIRNRMAVLLQRMILCLGDEILPKVPEFLQIVLLNCTTEEDVLDVSQLINQLCIKFKEGAAPAIDSSILPFLQRVLALQLSESSVVSSESVTPPPHLVTEQLSIRKQAFSTLQHVATHNASAVFYSENNAGAFEDILRLMNDGAVAVPDPVMKKTCIMFFGELTRGWGSDGCTVPANVRNGYFDFIYEVFIPGMLSCILDISFNAKDAMRYRVLAEFSAVLWLVKQSFRGHAEFHSLVSKLIENVCFKEAGPPSGVSPTIIATGFQKAGSEKDMELCLMAWKVGEFQCTKID
ncbi:hypothetical protein ACHAW6_013104 [Cyclotella cf. meneghiniana]